MARSKRRAAQSESDEEQLEEESDEEYNEDEDEAYEEDSEEESNGESEEEDDEEGDDDDDDDDISSLEEIRSKAKSKKNIRSDKKQEEEVRNVPSHQRRTRSATARGSKQVKYYESDESDEEEEDGGSREESEKKDHSAALLSSDAEEEEKSDVEDDEDLPKTRAEFMLKRRFYVNETSNSSSNDVRHGCAKIDAIDSSPLLPEHLVWRNGMGSSTYCYNFETVWKIAVQKKRWSEPPTFLEPMAEGTMKQIKERFGVDCRNVLPVEKTIVANGQRVQCLPGDPDYSSLLNAKHREILGRSDLSTCPICYELSLEEWKDREAEGESEPSPMEIVSMNNDFQGGALMCFPSLPMVKKHLKEVHGISATKREYSSILNAYKIRGQDGLVQRWVSHTDLAEDSFWFLKYWGEHATTFTHIQTAVKSLGHSMKKNLAAFPNVVLQRESNRVWNDILSSFGADEENDDDEESNESDEDAASEENHQQEQLNSQLDMKDEVDDIAELKKIAAEYDRKAAETHDSDEGLDWSEEDRANAGGSVDASSTSSSSDSEGRRFRASQKKAQRIRNVGKSRTESHCTKSRQKKKKQKSKSDSWSGEDSDIPLPKRSRKKVQQSPTKKRLIKSKLDSSEDESDGSLNLLPASSKAQSPTKRKRVIGDSDSSSDESLVALTTPVKPKPVVVTLDDSETSDDEIVLSRGSKLGLKKRKLAKSAMDSSDDDDASEVMVTQDDPELVHYQ